MDVRGRRVVLMGLGRFGGGVGAARYLARQGARLLVTDLADEASLRSSIDQLGDLTGIEYRLGDHLERDFTEADIIVANPAVRPGNTYIEAARRAGAVVTSEIRLLAQHLPNRAHTIGVTGTAGKSTTTAMIGHAMKNMADGGWRMADSHSPSAIHHSPSIWLGGNLGGSLLPYVDDIQPHDWVVLELSSFMLEGLRDDQWSPHVAVVTNFQPNHLDWHGSIESYQRAKQVILDFQRESEGDIAIGGPGVHDRFTNHVSDIRTLDASHTGGAHQPIELAVPGDHNQLNARLASTAIEAATGIPQWRALDALRDFTGLPHRLQLVAEYADVRFYNDSKSTTPDAAILAIDSFAPGTAHIILGGYDKGSDLTAMAQRAAEHCRAIYTLGQTGDDIARAAEAMNKAEVVRCGTLEQAMQAIAQRVRAGDAVLLSPGCASYDQFEHFEQRGARFTEAVLRYTTETGLTPRRS